MLGRSSLTNCGGDDPLTRAWSSSNMGGVRRWVRGVEDAIQDFVDFEYPNNILGGEQLRIIPDLGPEQDFRHLHSAQAGLVAGELETGALLPR